MVARWMEQKRMKQRRMRRAWAKPLERKSGITPNRIVINEYKERAKGLALDETAADKIAAKLLGQQQIFKGTPPGVVEARETIKEMQKFPGLNAIQREAVERKMAALARQGRLEALLDTADLRIRGPGPSNSYQESFMYFNSQKTIWRVLHRDLKEKIESLSIVYPSKEALIIRWEMDKITWIEYRSIVPA